MWTRSGSRTGRTTLEPSPHVQPLLAFRKTPSAHRVGRQFSGRSTAPMRRGDYRANNSCFADSTRSRNTRSRCSCFITFSTLWITVE